MQIDKALISRIEWLARLGLSDEEREAVRTDLNKVLDMVDVLQSINTEGVTPLVYLNPRTPDWREDVANEHLSRNRALKNAPAQDGTYFTVPKVIDLS